MECIILAGGRGTRLAPVLSNSPKPLAEIGGRPFIAHLLDELVRQGCTHIVLSVGYLAEQIQAHLGDAYRNCRISYAVEAFPHGTGGAVRLALQKSTEEDVFVLNGDTLLDLDYGRMKAAHAARSAAMTIALRRVADVSRYGAVVTDSEGIIRGFGEKSVTGPGWINSGAYLMHRSIFDGSDLPAAFSLESDFIANKLEQLRPFGFETDGYFIDIGTPEDLARAQAELPNRLKRF